ncbi:LLM class flavin-dependent oxidoreductase [Pseudomonas sp. 5P_3.1_Bac2]|uniref:LLM class flavin-dependent oxidoreductase n=1 Tax=Pseudomonas sp. 5P_3.1_Bac2 TaxID=2971617 RepID=UPI0021C6C2A4|nr:LLM class flavin-dependent oxidoreductase [Pseudomonas sp. 5P_3.1_Bac2]MCU1717231.1 LLM class flavin-dependent oxidoreductase [Pseudomonas sp. 5P_3.1_Bac2]
MSTASRQMSIGMNILGFGAHAAAWREAEAPATAMTDVQYFINIAKISERGTLDAIFLADGPALAGDLATQPAGRLEPTVLLTAIALATQHIGVIATASSTFNEPYNLARRLASVDHISGGRAAWNVVTTYNDAAAQNFGQSASAPHAERYGRAAEFIEVVQKLWDSWEDDAIIGDPVQGLFAERDKVHSIEHVGEHFAVRGPLNLPRSPQGRPVLVQAGSSEQGKALGSRYADAIFTTQTTLAGGQGFYQDMKQRARQWGRDPQQLKIMPGLATVIASTEAEAQARFTRLNDYLGESSLAQQIAWRIGIPLAELDLDAELPWQRISAVSELKSSHGFLEAQLNLARQEKLSVRQLARRILVGHRLLVGTPEQVADSLAEWFLSGAADGFNIMPDVFPSGVQVFVDEVVPLLRKRGLFRHEYSASTLRGHLGLAYPANQFTPSRSAASA